MLPTAHTSQSLKRYRVASAPWLEGSMSTGSRWLLGIDVNWRTIFVALVEVVGSGGKVLRSTSWHDMTNGCLALPADIRYSYNVAIEDLPSNVPDLI
ncbi:hypothetical protein V6N13_057918 [Hibiscus sabdariffa]|uniref:Uncharacterized protein n=1 Tax=Hibiscus sabdariffa TaxID=183260 RepID=A0ABR2GHP8_9ROSI